MARSSLRILGVGDAKSRHFARWATRLAERGHEVHVASGRVNPREGELDGLVVHQFQDLDPLLRVPLVRRFRMAPGPRRARAARAAGRRPLPLPPAVRLLDGARRARAARRQPVGEGRDRRRLAVARGRGAGARRRSRRSALSRTSSTRRRSRTRRSGSAPTARSSTASSGTRASTATRPSTPTAAAGSALGWPDDAVVCLSLRNFRPYSNLDIVLRAFAKARQEVPELRLFSSAGGGWTRDEFDRLAAELGVEPYMAVRDVPAAELPSVTASADFAVTLADVDSSPASLLETMASGVPLVVGLAPSMDEWIQQGEGGELVDDRHDVDAVAAAMVAPGPRRGAAPPLRRAEPPRGARPLRRPDRPARAGLPRGARPVKRVLALAFDGADYDLVRRLMGEGKLPTISRLAREGAFGPLRSTIPAFTPTAWSSFLTGLNPGRPRHLQLHDQPEPRHAEARERRQPRRDAALADARPGRDPLGVRRHPVHVPGGAARRDRRHRLRRPRAAADPAGERRGADLRRLPRPRHGAPPDGGALVGGLPRLHGPAARARGADGRRLQARLRAGARPRPALRRLHEHRPRRPPRLRPLRPGASRRTRRPAPATSSCRSTSASTRCAAS